MEDGTVEKYGVAIHRECALHPQPRDRGGNVVVVVNEIASTAGMEVDGGGGG